MPGEQAATFTTDVFARIDLFLNRQWHAEGDALDSLRACLLYQFFAFFHSDVALFSRAYELLGTLVSRATRLGLFRRGGPGDYSISAEKLASATPMALVAHWRRWVYAAVCRRVAVCLMELDSGMAGRLGGLTPVLIPVSTIHLDLPTEAGGLFTAPTAVLWAERYVQAAQFEPARSIEDATTDIVAASRAGSIMPSPAPGEYLLRNAHTVVAALLSHVRCRRLATMVRLKSLGGHPIMNAAYSLGLPYPCLRTSNRCDRSTSGGAHM
jgi:hypothetical protein